MKIKRLLVGALCLTLCSSCFLGCQSSDEIGEKNYTIKDWVYTNETIFNNVEVEFPYYDSKSQYWDIEDSSKWVIKSNEEDEGDDSVNGSSSNEPKETGLMDLKHGDITLYSVGVGNNDNLVTYYDSPVSECSASIASIASREYVYPNRGSIDIEHVNFASKATETLGSEENTVNLEYISEDIKYNKMDSNEELGTVSIRGYVSAGNSPVFFGYIGTTPDNDTEYYLKCLFRQIFSTAKVE